MTLRLRLILAMCVGMALTLAAGYYVGSTAAGSLQKTLTEAHDAHLLNTLESNVQSRLSIGLLINQLETLQPTIELERANAPGVLSIDLYSDKGVLLYSTDRSAVGSRVPAEWLSALKNDGRWHINGMAERVIGVRIEDDLGAPVGGIALTIDTRATHPSWSLRGLANALPNNTLVLSMLVCLLAGALTSAWALTRLFRPTEAAHSVLTKAGVDAVAPDNNPLAFAAWQRRRLWATLHRDLDDGLAQLEALDRDN